MHETGAIMETPDSYRCQECGISAEEIESIEQNWLKREAMWMATSKAIGMGLSRPFGADTMLPPSLIAQTWSYRI